MSVLDPPIFTRKVHIHIIDHVPTLILVSWGWYIPWLQDLECNYYIGHFQSNRILPEYVAVVLINPF